MSLLPIVKIWLKAHPLLIVSFEFLDEDNIQMDIFEGTTKLTTVTLTPELQERLVAIAKEKR
jgi:hypothetical protein